MSVCLRLQSFGESIFTTMSRLANEHAAINLSQGFPDFDGPQWLKEAACRAILSGPNQYAPSPGLPELRRALARKAARDYGLEYDPDTEITVTCGATEAIFSALVGLLNPGDEVIILEPYYDSYPACVAVANGVPRYVALRQPDFGLDLESIERALTPRTRALLLNTPHNPTGAVVTRSELEALAELVRAHPQLVVITDEVYEHLVYPPHEHVPLATLPGMRDRTILISSTSKTLSMTGWKVGYVYAPMALTQAVRAAHQFTTFCAVAPLQAAMAEAIDRLGDYLGELRQTYLARRDQMVEALREAGLPVAAPAGTYFIITDVTGLGLGNDVEFCRTITSELKVAAIPCSAFYHYKESGRNLVRWAFCKNAETLGEAGRRLQGLKQLCDRNPMASFLEAARREGRLESVGDFHLDFTRARDLLRKFRLPTPYYYQHKLVQAAVALGATRVEANFEPSNSHWIIGQALAGEVLEQMPSFLVDHDTGWKRALGHLAVALDAALMVAPKVEIESWTPRGGTLLTVETKGSSLKRDLPPAREGEGIRFTVHYPWWKGITSSGLEGWHKGGSFKHCGIPYINLGTLENWFPRRSGRPSGPMDIPLAPATRWERYFVAPYWEATQLVAPTARLSQLEQWRLVDHWPNGSVVHWDSQNPLPGRVPELTLAGQPGVGCYALLFGRWGGSELTWVHDGVAIECRYDIKPPGCESLSWSGIVITQGLKTDVSGFKVVHDEAFEAVLRFLGAQIQEAS